MRNFRKLKVWQVASSLPHDVSASAPPSQWRHLPGLHGQVMRACQSIALNIAEGCGRDSDLQLRNSINISLGSLAEFESGLQSARDGGVLVERAHLRLTARILVLRRMLLSFRATLRD